LNVGSKGISPDVSAANLINTFGEAIKHSLCPLLVPQLVCCCKRGPIIRREALSKPIAILDESRHGLNVALVRELP
jgi:hypothetical protein